MQVIYDASAIETTSRVGSHTFSDMPFPAALQNWWSHLSYPCHDFENRPNKLFERTICDGFVVLESILARRKITVVTVSNYSRLPFLHHDQKRDQHSWTFCQTHISNYHTAFRCYIHDETESSRLMYREIVILRDAFCSFHLEPSHPDFVQHTKVQNLLLNSNIALLCVCEWCLAFGNSKQNVFAPSLSILLVLLIFFFFLITGRKIYIIIFIKIGEWSVEIEPSIASLLNP